MKTGLVVDVVVGVIIVVAADDDAVVVVSFFFFCSVYCVCSFSMAREHFFIDLLARFVDNFFSPFFPTYSIGHELPNI